jgi:hypothetical protein
MSEFLSRRSLLAGVGSAAVCGSFASSFISLAQAGEAAAPAAAPAAPQMAFSMMFMAGKKTKFDLKKYESKHLPLLKQSYGDSVSRIEMLTANATARGGTVSDIRVTTTLYIANLQQFAKLLGAAAPTVNTSIADISTGPTNAQLDRLLYENGKPRSEVLEGHQVVSTYYKEKAGATFDTQYFTEVYLPKLRSYYGDGAVRRIEAFMGVPQGGTKPAIVAALHLYIRDRDAFNSANGEGQKELMQIDNKYYPPEEQMWADSKVTAVL